MTDNQDTAAGPAVNLPADPPAWGALTLRDYFAGQALAGLISLGETEKSSPEEFAIASYLVAEAMVMVREFPRGDV